MENPKTHVRITNSIATALSFLIVTCGVWLVISPSSLFGILNSSVSLNRIELSLSRLLGGILFSCAIVTLLVLCYFPSSSLFILLPPPPSESNNYGGECPDEWRNMAICRVSLFVHTVFGLNFIIFGVLSVNSGDEGISSPFSIFLIFGCLVLLLSSSGFMVSCWPRILTSVSTQFNSFQMDNEGEEETNTTPLLSPSKEAEDQNVYAERCSISLGGDSKYASKTVSTMDMAKEEEGEPISSELTSNCNDENDVNDDESSNNISSDRITGIRRILQLAKKEKFTLLLACFTLLVRLPFSLSIPHFVSTCIGSLSREEYQAAYEDILSIIILGTIDSILDFWCVYLFGAANQSIVKNLRLNTFQSILSQEINFFDSIMKTGELTSRLTSDCSAMGSDLTWFFRFSIEAFVRITGISAYMLIRCPLLGVTALSIVPVVAIVNKFYGDWLAKNSKAVQEALADANNVSQESFACIRTVVAFATEDFEYKKYFDKIQVHYRLNMKQLFATGVYYMMISTFLINTCLQATLLFVGAKFIEDGKMTHEILLAFMLYQGQLQEYTLQLFNSFTSLIKSSGAGEKIFELIDRKPFAPGIGSDEVKCSSVVENMILDQHISSSSSTGGSSLLSTSSFIWNEDIRFTNVDFAYPSRPSQNILLNINIVIPNGSTIALVGPSGCGKSTIVSLLQRFHDPTAGQITLGGIDLRDLDIHEFRKKIGIVNQDPVLFSGSILSNIIYGSSNLTKAEAIEAAKLANAHSFIEGFPEGYDTEVGERGVQLSGGQKQRLAIARAIAKKPSLLLLDEATSALDHDSEQIVQAALDNFLQLHRQGQQCGLHFDNNGSDETVGDHVYHTMTTIIVAHRLQTVRNANCIVVMQPGVEGIVDFGTHEELMSKKDGYYCRLVSTFGSSVEEKLS